MSRHARQGCVAQTSCGSLSYQERMGHRGFRLTPAGALLSATTLHIDGGLTTQPGPLSRASPRPAPRSSRPPQGGGTPSRAPSAICLASVPFFSIRNEACPCRPPRRGSAGDTKGGKTRRTDERGHGEAENGEARRAHRVVGLHHPVLVVREAVGHALRLVSVATVSCRG